jgi:hypothetical protein
VAHPDRDADSEPYNLQAVWDIYLATDIRPAIRAARRATMRRVLTAVTRQLCHLLNTQPPGIAVHTPDPRQPYDICQIGAAMPAGLQLYHHLTQATAAHYLCAAILDPAEAATSRAYERGLVVTAAGVASYAPHLPEGELVPLARAEAHPSALMPA